MIETHGRCTADPQIPPEHVKRINSRASAPEPHGFMESLHASGGCKRSKAYKTTIRPSDIKHSRHVNTFHITFHIILPNLSMVNNVSTLAARTAGMTRSRCQIHPVRQRHHRRRTGAGSSFNGRYSGHLRHENWAFWGSQKRILSIPSNQPRS